MRSASQSRPKLILSVSKPGQLVHVRGCLRARGTTFCEPSLAAAHNSTEDLARRYITSSGPASEPQHEREFRTFGAGGGGQGTPCVAPETVVAPGYAYTIPVGHRSFADRVRSAFSSLLDQTRRVCSPRRGGGCKASRSGGDGR